jgi:hypothetical protein
MESLKILSKVNLHTSHIRKQKANLFSLINYHSKRIIKRGIASKEDVQTKLQSFNNKPLTIDKLQAQLNLLKSYDSMYSFNWFSQNANNADDSWNISVTPTALLYNGESAGIITTGAAGWHNVTTTAAQSPISNLLVSTYSSS